MKETITKHCVAWIKDYFDKKGKGAKAVVGISGGKDSSVVAALCVEALGKKNVIGVLMPNGVQNDIDDSRKICAHLGIKPYTVNIGDAYKSISTEVWKSSADISELTKQAKINIAPRLRMTTLYAVAQCVNGRVINTTNKDEALVGYGTLWGDTVGDLAPIANLHVSEVIKMGLDLGLPEWSVIKPPADGLTGNTDADELGFTYAEVEGMYNKWTDHRSYQFNDVEKKIHARMQQYAWKRELICGIPSFDPYDIKEEKKKEATVATTGKAVPKTSDERIAELEQRIVELEKKLDEHINDFAKHQGMIINVPAPTEPQQPMPTIPWNPYNPQKTYPYYPTNPYGPIWCGSEKEITINGENTGNYKFVYNTNNNAKVVSPVNWNEPNCRSYTVSMNAQTNMDNKPKA